MKVNVLWKNNMTILKEMGEKKKNQPKQLRSSIFTRHKAKVLSTVLWLINVFLTGIWVSNPETAFAYYALELNK